MPFFIFLFLVLSFLFNIIINIRFHSCDISKLLVSHSGIHTAHIFSRKAISARAISLSSVRVCMRRTYTRTYAFIKTGGGMGRGKLEKDHKRSKKIHKSQIITGKRRLKYTSCWNVFSPSPPLFVLTPTTPATLSKFQPKEGGTTKKYILQREGELQITYL